MMENKFRPTPEELVLFLIKKITDPAFTDPRIGELNIYKHRPLELPGLSPIQSDEQVWYFFCPLNYKYAKSERANRKAIGGSWKITAPDRDVKAKHSNKTIGCKKTLVFYQGSNFRKENKTNYVMHEYHLNKDPLFKDKLVVCRIELKPDKKHKPPSSLDEGQSSDSLAYDSPNNVAQDIPEVECHLPQNPRLPSSSNNDVANNNLMEVEPQPLPNQMGSQLLPKPHISSSGEDHDAKYNFPEPMGSNMHSPIHLPPGSSYSSSFGNVSTKGLLDHNSSSALQSPIHLHPGSSYSSGFSNDSTNGLDHNCFSTPQSLIHPQPGSSYSTGFSNDLTNGLHHNSFSTPQSLIHPLLGSSYSSGFSNDSTNVLDHYSFSALESPIHPQPGSTYSSGFSNGPNVRNPQFAAEQEDDLANSHWSECHLPQNPHLPSSSNNDVVNNNLMEVEPQPPPNQLESQPLPNQLGPQPQPNQLESQPLPNPPNLSSGEDHDAKYNFPEPMGSNMHLPIHLPPGSSYSSSFGIVSTKGLLDHNSSSTLQSPIHPHPGSSYWSGFINDSTNGLDHNCFSTPQLLIHPQLGSSYSTGFSNDSTNVLDQYSFSALKSPIHPQPGSSYPSGFSNGPNVWNPQFAAEQEDDLANSHWSDLDQMISLLQKLDTRVLQTSTHKWQSQEVMFVLEVMQSLRDSLLRQMCILQGSNEDI